MLPFGSGTVSEPRTTDYCLKCGHSPESGDHLFDHSYVDPRPARVETELDHWHCPYGCDRPQKFKLELEPNANAIELGMEEGVWYCGCCFFKYDDVVKMLLCTPETCD